MQSILNLPNLEKADVLTIYINA